jgi:cytochrome c peroxidase
VKRAIGIAAALVIVAGCAEPPPFGLDPAFYALCRDELGLGDRHCASVAAWRLPEALPEARGNAVADDERAAALGRAIFFDEGFATVAGVSCASCHRPELAFADGLRVSEVIPGSPGARNSPSLYNAAWNTGFFFWDGRADSLWSQPLFAFENEIEMNTTRLAIAHRVLDAYRAPYEDLFGALPPLDDEARFPLAGKPGDASWEAMADDDRRAIDRVAANVGKALEAYMRRIAAGPSAVDRYLDGDADALEPDQARGLARFVLSGCETCHSGPALTDDRFHASSVGSDADDRGRAAGVEVLLASPFNSEGEHFDRDAGAPLALPLGPTAADEHAFRTPSMRNVALTAPYQHDGSRSLEEILAAQGLLYEPGDEVVIDAFLRALSGAPPPAEWASPP